MQQLIILFFLFLITAYWIDTARVKEIARHVCKRSCREHNVQLLDNTVVKQKTFIKKQPYTLFAIFRQYSFEYSFNGDERLHGIIIMNGHRLHEVQMDLHTFDGRKIS